MIPGRRRSPGERNDSPFQYSCLGNPMNKGAWRATVHGVAKSQLQLSDYPTTPRCLHVPKFHTPEHLSFQKKCAHTHTYMQADTCTLQRDGVTKKPSYHFPNSNTNCQGENKQKDVQMALATLIRLWRGRNRITLAMKCETKELALSGIHDDVLLAWNI